jgi:hypothetical protein
MLMICGRCVILLTLSIWLIRCAHDYLLKRALKFEEVIGQAFSSLRKAPERSELLPYRVLLKIGQFNVPRRNGIE